MLNDETLIRFKKTKMVDLRVAGNIITTTKCIKATTKTLKRYGFRKFAAPKKPVYKIF